MDMRAELEAINGFAKTALTEGQVYAFSLKLCDNEVDRDFERFDAEALETLGELFLGRSGLFDHQWSALGQTARIYRTEVVEEPGRVTAAGDRYRWLKAWAYLMRTEKHEDLIAEIEGGIKKEVSVGCSVARHVCSICGAEAGTCAHVKGRLYGETLCFTELREPTDAYEWSFVAVPAQREAGVIKMYTPTDTEEGTRTSSDIIKAFSEGKEMTLSPEECAEISGCLRELAKKAEAGEAYERELRQEVVRLSLLSQPGVPKDIMERVAKRMTLEELKAFQKAYRQESGKLAPPKPQLAGARAEGAPIENAEFKI